MHDIARLIPLLEAAKRCLISTPWEKEEEEDGPTDQRKDKKATQRPVEPVAAAVLCQLLDVRRMHSLLQAANERRQQQQHEPRASENVGPSRTSPPSSGTALLGKVAEEVQRKKKMRGRHREQTTRCAHQQHPCCKEDRERCSVETQVLCSTVERYLSVLRGCSSYVQALCSVSSTGGQKKNFDAGEVVAFRGATLDAVNVVDVFFTLVLFMAVALCWQHKIHQQQLAASSHGSSRDGGKTNPNNENNRADVVSSSRGTSAHSQKSFSFATASAAQRATRLSDSVYDMIRDYYILHNEHREKERNGDERGGLRAVLQRVLPLLESRLPATELWREPSLLAALDVLACGVWFAQARVHTPTPSSKHCCHGRCPLCYAAALNSDLVVETVVQLNNYFMIYHGEEIRKSEEETRRQSVRPDSDDDGTTSRANQQHQQQQGYVNTAVQARGWVAACRIALWNENRAALTRLTAPRPPPWLLLNRNALLTSSAEERAAVTPFFWTRGAACVLSLLWSCWWRAEVHLAIPLKEQAGQTEGQSSLSSVSSVIRRDAAQRFRCCQLFLNAVFPSSSSSPVEPPIARSSFIDASDTNRNGKGASATGKHNRNEGSYQKYQVRPQMVLSWLLCLPLSLTGISAHATTSKEGEVQKGSNASNKSSVSEVIGPILHWLCAQDDVVLLRFLLLQFSTHDLRQDLPMPNSEQQSTLDATHFNANSTISGSLTNSNGIMTSYEISSPPIGLTPQTTPSLYHAPHVVQLTETSPNSSGYDNDNVDGPYPIQSAGGTLNKGPYNRPTSSGACLVSHNSSLLDILRLRDTQGFSALDVACQHHNLPCARLLLQCGLSPNSLSLSAWHIYAAALPLPLLRLLYAPSVLDGAATVCSSDGKGDSSANKSSLVDRLMFTSCPTSAARTLAQLAYRLWTEKVQHFNCPAMETAFTEAEGQGDRRWTPSSKQHQQQSGETLQEGLHVANAFNKWYSEYLQCQAAQDRVLRPALAALAYDAHEPLARLVILAVLTRKLNTWLITVPPYIRSEDGSSFSKLINRYAVNESLRELRLHHTVALRLYTQLTCVLGRGLLRAAVEVRGAICAAVEMREEKAAALLLASVQATSLPDTPTPTTGAVAVPSPHEEDADKTVNPNEATTVLKQQQLHSRQSVPLPLSEAGKARHELQALYATVLADAQQLDQHLAVEQRRVTASLIEQQKQNDCEVSFKGSKSASSGVATVLRGLRANKNSKSCGDEHGIAADVPSYVLVVIPSALALQRARWRTKQHTLKAHSTSSPDCEMLIEPTLWCATHTPQQVWLQLPRHLDLDELLRTHDGGGYGMVAHDMPPTAPMQRGDLVTFRHIRRTNNSKSNSGSRSAAAAPATPQFVAQSIFSEYRTLPYLVLKQPNSTFASSPSDSVSPPASLVLPYRAVPQSTSDEHSASNPPLLSKAASAFQQLHLATTLTLHACCVPLLYIDGIRAKFQGTDEQQQHPLNWLQVRPSTATTTTTTEASRRQKDNGKRDSASPADGDILAVLQTNRSFISWWSRLVWAGLRPCWLAQATTAPAADMESRNGEAGSVAVSRLHPSTTVNQSSNVSVVNLLGKEDVETERTRQDSCDEADVHRSFMKNVTAEKVVLTVRLAAAHSSIATDSGDELAMEWPSRADGSVGGTCEDVVVDVAL